MAMTYIRINDVLAGIGLMSFIFAIVSYAHHHTHTGDVFGAIEMAVAMINPYRSPAPGMVLVPARVPEVSTLRCRLFGHKLRGSTCVIGFIHEFPNAAHAPSEYVIVWCKRCGREWRRSVRPCGECGYDARDESWDERA